MNTRRHMQGLMLFSFIMIAHWCEHVVQIYQIYVLHMPLNCALGMLGMRWPMLVSTEWMHFGYAVLTMAGLVLLKYGFAGKARTWWMIAYGIQIWHLFEHTLLFIQAQTHHFWFGKAVPTSILQLVFPRAELHLVYNTLVTIPMVIAMVYYFKARRRTREFKDLNVRVVGA